MFAGYRSDSIEHLSDEDDLNSSKCLSYKIMCYANCLIDFS